MINKLLKAIKNPMVLTSFVIALVVIIAFSTRMEQFSKSTRYFYMFNAPPRNSSYDTRGEQISIQKNTSKTGVFYESPLDANETNYRVRPFYHGLREDTIHKP